VIRAGCDIHIYVEIRKSIMEKRKLYGGINRDWRGDEEEMELVGYKWEKVGKVFKNLYHNPERLKKWEEGRSGREGHREEDDDEDEWASIWEEFTECPYRDRNYDLFAILADVRNGSGFAGDDTGDGFVPICETRGLPDDVDEEIGKISDKWGGDGHSHSWVTLKELYEYDWDRTTKHRGYVGPGQYRLFKEEGRPASYCTDTSGKKITIAEMDRYISENNIKIPDKKDRFGFGSPSTRVEWEMTYRESVSDFIDNTMVELAELDDNPENIRIVFWFDN